MASVINTNILSLNAQRNLNTNSMSLSQTIARLSSGLRINSAKDDAAGLAISERFSTQINGLNQAQRNANDGISLSQTAEGGLAEITNNLQRIRELAVQSANATNSASDRAALDQEVQQRLAEIDRTSAQSTFNGQKILDGTFGAAVFQVGADAGQTISLSLAQSTRTSAIGAIATETSAALGGAGSFGQVAITPLVGGLNMSQAAVAQTDQSISFNPSTLLYATAASAGAGGFNSTASVAATYTDFSTAATAQVDGQNVQAAIVPTSLDFSGTSLAQFDVGGQSVTLNTNVTDSTGLAAAIQGQLTGITVTAESTTQITFHRTGSLTTVAVSSSDVNAIAAGFADSAGSGGTAATAGTNATFSVGGTAVTLNANYGSTGAVASALQGQLAGYSVSYSGGSYTFTNNLSTTAPAITNSGVSSAYANTVGFDPGAGTAGTAAVSSTNAGFVIDGQTIHLNSDFASYAALAAHIDTDMGAGYTVTATGGTGIKVVKDGVAGGTLAASALTGIASAAGYSTGTASTGASAVTTTNVGFKVDGTTILLNSNYTGAGGMTQMASDISTQLGNSNYQVSVSGGTQIVISNHTAAGTAAPVISVPLYQAVTDGFTSGTSTAGTAAGLTLTNFAVTDSFGKSTTFSGSFTGSTLAAAVNNGVNGVFASYDSTTNKVSISSSAAFTLAGSDATTMGFTLGSHAASNGTLTSVNVNTVASANDAIVRVDSALQTVSSLRSTFGAIQNRFESTIASLATAAENLTASRSRIRDTDFAKETAELTRTQILQQAGTAMLAQANQAPQNILALLR